MLDQNYFFIGVYHSYARCRGFLETRWTRKRPGSKALMQVKFASEVC
jgi:hypothetical protein